MNWCDYGHFRRRNPIVPLHQGYRQTESDSEHANDRHPAIFDPHHQRGFRVAHATRGARDLRTAAVLRTRHVTAVCLEALRSQKHRSCFSTAVKIQRNFKLQAQPPAPRRSSRQNPPRSSAPSRHGRVRARLVAPHARSARRVQRRRRDRWNGPLPSCKLLA